MRAHEYITVTFGGEQDDVNDAVWALKDFVKRNATVKRVLLGTLSDAMSPDEIAEWERRTGYKAEREGEHE